MQVSQHQSISQNPAVMDLSFEVVKYDTAAGCYSKGCSNDARSACCTRVCTQSNMQMDLEASGLKSWEQYLEINAGVLQY